MLDGIECYAFVEDYVRRRALHNPIRTVETIHDNSTNSYLTFRTPIRYITVHSVNGKVTSLIDINVFII